MGGQRVGQRDAVAVAGRRGRRAGRASRSARPEPSSERPKRAPSSSAQSTSATVTGRRAARGEGAQDLEAAEDAERAVEPAAVGDGVDVAAEHDVSGAPAREDRPEVAGLVGVDRHRQLGEALAQPGARLRPGVGPRDALGAALVLGQLAQRAEVRERALGIRVGRRPSRAQHNRARRSSAAPGEPLVSSRVRRVPGQRTTDQGAPTMPKTTAKTADETAARPHAPRRQPPGREAVVAQAGRRAAPVSHEQIALRAYELHLLGAGADPMENWLRAERELVAAA